MLEVLAHLCEEAASGATWGVATPSTVASGEQKDPVLPGTEVPGKSDRGGCMSISGIFQSGYGHDDHDYWYKKYHHHFWNHEKRHKHDKHDHKHDTHHHDKNHDDC